MPRQKTVRQKIRLRPSGRDVSIKIKSLVFNGVGVFRSPQYPLYDKEPTNYPKPQEYEGDEGEELFGYTILHIPNRLVFCEVVLPRGARKLAIEAARSFSKIFPNRYLSQYEIDEIKHKHDKEIKRLINKCLAWQDNLVD